jgi:hypothetical protein
MKIIIEALTVEGERMIESLSTTYYNRAARRMQSIQIISQSPLTLEITPKNRIIDRITRNIPHYIESGIVTQYMELIESEFGLGPDNYKIYVR